jgi:uncharacterized cupredoxin-like copper-binding protein
MKMNTTWIIVIVIILVVLGIILLSSPKAEAPKGNVPVEGEEGALPEEGEALPEEVEEVLEGAEEIIPEGSKVSEEGKVLTDSGEEADNTALPGSPEAPKQSRALAEEEIPSEAIKLSVSAAGFEPNEFTVKAGEPVTISVTSTDKTHVFKFDAEVLRAVAVGVAGGETRAITFNAPEAGDYTFFCDVPGHRGRGETGVMHVK